ncbi:30S ribosomal protein S6 [Patescibacteria group bacterium]
MEYEICYLIGESKEVELDSIKEGVEKIVTEAGGTFIEGEFKEKRKMAYEIKKEIRGIYVARRFNVDKNSDAVSEITGELNLNNDVLRFIVVKTDELPELRESELDSNGKVVEKKVEEKRSRPVKRTLRKEAREVKKEEVKEVKKEEVKKEEVKKEEVKKEVKKEEVKDDKKNDSKKEPESKEEFDKKLDDLLNI